MTGCVPLTRVPRRVRLRVEDYLALDDAGAFGAYGKTELLDGEIVYMNAQHRPHVKNALTLQMWSPAGEAYAERRELPFGDPVAAATPDGLTVETTTL